MTTVRTLCPDCAIEVDVKSDAILLLLQGDEEEGSYAFVCPQCDAFQDKPAPRKIAMLLIAAGCPLDAA